MNEPSNAPQSAPDPASSIPPTSATPAPPSRRISLVRSLRNRVIAGLFVSLPVLITFLVIVYICNLLITYLIGPIARLLLMIVNWRFEDIELGFWIEYIAAPLAAMVIVLVFLFFAGIFVRTRLHRLLDWIMRTVPGVNTIYAAVANVFDSVQRAHSGGDMNFQRVVLIEFPHPGCKVPAFVTNECRDQATGQKIICVYVPTTPIPTSGYMLLIPEKNVIPLDWDIQSTLQAIVSGGITVPPTVNYMRDDSLPTIQTDAPTSGDN